MTRYEITAENGSLLDDDKKFIKKTADEPDFMEEAMFANLAENYVYLWGKVYDKDTGLQKINVKQFRKAYHVSSTDELTADEESITHFIPGYNNIQTIDDGNGNTIFCVKIDLLEPNRAAGDVLFEITVEDGSENINKGGSLKISGIVTVNFNLNYRVNHNNNFTVGNLIDNLSTIYFILPKTVAGLARQVLFALYSKYDDDDPNLTDVWNGYIEGHKLNYECEYIDKSGETKYLEFVKAENPGLYTNDDGKIDLYYVQLNNFDEDNIGGKCFTVNIKHDKYVLWSREYNFPQDPYVQSIYENNGTKYISFGKIDGYLRTQKSNNSNFSNDSVQPLSNDYEVYAYTTKSFGGDYYQMLYGDKIGPFVLGSASGEKPNTPVINDRIIRPSQSGYVDIIFDIEAPDENGTLKKWDQIYDSILLEYIYRDKSTKISINKGSEVAVNIQVYLLESDVYYIPKVKVFGVKNFTLSDPSIEYEIKLKDEEDINTYDKTPPKGPNSSVSSSRFPDKDNFVLLFNDDLSGMAEGSITVGDKTFELYPSQVSAGGWYETQIPADLFKPYNKSYVYYLKDNAGNINSGMYHMDMSPQKLFVTDGPKGTINGDKWTSKFAQTPVIGTLYCSEYDSGWQTEKEISRLNNYTINIENGARFVKFHNIRKDFGNWWDYYEICYTGEYSQDNDYNLLFFNGSNQSSVAVSSNAPVLVCTLSTTRPYNECKNWTIAQWQTFPKEIDIKEFSFETPGITKRYNIPVDKINEGECYVVIAHYADGSAQKTEVMQYNP